MTKLDHKIGKVSEEGENESLSKVLVGCVCARDGEEGKPQDGPHKREEVEKPLQTKLQNYACPILITTHMWEIQKHLQ